MRIPRLIAVAAIAVTVASCTNSTAPTNTIVGAWQLRTWDGKALPAMTYGVADGYRELLVAEKFVISDDGTYTFSRTMRFMPEGRSETRTGAGSWEKMDTGFAIGRGRARGRLSSESLIVQWSGDGKTDSVYELVN